MLNFSYIKFLKYINKVDKVSMKDLMNKYNINNADASKILNCLVENKYIYYTSTGYHSTYKGKHFISDWLMHWLGINFIAILALIVSTIALIFSGIALFNSQL